ncbi:uncharacterized protein BcabD6B2_28970 [Babesia caballi]|uniref:Transmembrane protein, putative n=1 Tax=Babesia caballi TaxID=5871 RepID=A0AAV4LV21_BABCB|nr:transmembrane protein, putative [Babesia caballi]
MKAVPPWTFAGFLLVSDSFLRVLLLGSSGVDGFRRHGSTPRAPGCSRPHGALATPQDGPGEERGSDDREIVERLEKDRMEKMARYLAPMEAANIQDLDQRELSRTFGEAHTQENIKKRRQRSARLMEMEAPVVPFTDKLPYFVNLENPRTRLGDGGAPAVIEESTSGSSSVTGGGREGSEMGGGQKGQLGNEDPHGKHCTAEGGSPGDEGCGVIRREGKLAAPVGGVADSDKEPSVEEDKHGDGMADARKEAPGQVGGMVLFNDPRHQLFEARESSEYIGDPLDPYFDAAEQQASSDEEEQVDGEMESDKQAWYRDRPMRELLPREMADGWSILPCGRIYKHMLRPSEVEPEKRRKPRPETYVSFAFKIVDAFTADVLLDSTDAESDGLVSQLKHLGDGLEKMLASMVEGEQAEFVCHAVELGLANLQEEGLENLEWIRVWIHLVMTHERGEKWWHLSPLEAARYPPPGPEPGNLTKMERLNLKTEELKKQIENELENNPCSPLWEDVMQRLSAQQKASVVEHFDRKLELQERQRCAEFSGSRGFGETIKSTGQLQGYDVGRVSGGSGSCYTWHETPFVVYIAVPVVPGVRAEHVSFKLETSHLTLRVAGQTVIDDDMTGPVATDIATSWAMSEKAMEYEPLPQGHPDLRDPVLKVSMEDEYRAMTRDPCILIALKKRDKAMGDWGAPFVNI